MFEKRRTLLARAREGSGRVQVEAAALVSLTRGTLNAYESGKRHPSAEKTWEILEQLALGQRSPREGRPCLLISFALAGQRLLSVGGDLLSFVSLENASRASNAMEAYALERVLVVPAWESCVQSMLARNRGRPETSGRVVAFEQLGRGLDDVLDQAMRELVENVRPWLEEAIANATPADSGEPA